MSFGIIAREVLTRRNVARLAAKTAKDVWMLDQRGCLSPGVLYVEEGGELTPAAFARTIQERLKKMSGGWRYTVWHAGRRRKRGKIVCVPIFPKGWLAVRSFWNWDEVRRELEPIKRYLQAASLECAPARRRGIAERLSALGVNRICRAGRLQAPPLSWHHDGRPNLAEWLSWTDLET